MFASIFRTFLNQSHSCNLKLKTISVTQKQSSRIFNSINEYNFGNKKKRVIELNTSKIDLESLTSRAQAETTEAAKQSYLEMRQKI